MKPIIAISIGDINGIGPEIVIKTLADQRILDLCIPVIYASSKVIAYHKNIVKPEKFDFQSIRDLENPRTDRINVVNVWTEDINIELGTGSEDSGKFAYISLDRATQDVKEGLADALVTAPFNKHIMDSAGFPYAGHTEYLEAQCQEPSLMFMVSDDLRIGVATNHIPVAEVAPTLTKALVLKKTKIMLKSLSQDFGIAKPRIAILGLNPHAGDQGTIGGEEDELIRPVVSELSRKGHLVTGPHAADGFFGVGNQNKVDGILAMYHDQGLIPFKTLSFGRGVNYTAGLPIVRTSPDHGTGFNIAGRNLAEPDSFRQALFMAIDVVRSRSEYVQAEDKLARETLVEDTGEDESIEQITEQVE
ncbi:MAG: 4-hydroxythreonine-4-phosphate dehydrogenase PdxA [Saprospiraceae bacterium]|nr:4-hydroxythreonine-4-phosphate dehydrogenase PdxA [Saprospiraceae bacterium]